jgi:hypothetical protein
LPGRWRGTYPINSMMTPTTSMSKNHSTTAARSDS